MTIVLGEKEEIGDNTTKGIKQRLTHLRFNWSVEVAMKKLKINLQQELKYKEKKIPMLIFADDLVLLT